MDQKAQGWQPDPLGRHEQRWISSGEPTELVRDSGPESRDPADRSAPLSEIGMDVLPTDRPLPLPWRQSRRQRILVLAALGCAVVASLVAHFGHVSDPPKPLGPNEAIGTVLFVEVSSHYVEATYTPPGNTDAQGMASAYINRVAAGQTVVVRYNPNQPTVGTVLSQPTPHSSPNLYGVFLGVLGFVGFGTLWVVSAYRKWRLYKARRDATDYRVGPWAGTTNSA
jgi:hypothetical protein